ncbi:MAG: AEC family transporter [Roseovarius sp.]
MNNILAVLADPILPIFAIAALGYLLGARGLVREEDARLANRICMTIFMPILIFGLLARSDFSAFLWEKLALYAACEIVLFALCVLIARRIFGCGPGESVLLGVCGVFSNSLMYILPIAQLAYGEASVGPVVSVVVFDTVVFFGGALVYLELQRAKAESVAQALGSLVRMPLIAAMILGVAAGLMRLPLPEPVLTFIGFNGAAAPPIALFALGVVLSRTRFAPDGVVLTFGTVKLLIFPAALWLALETFTPGITASSVQFLLAGAGPAGAMAFSMALLYNVRPDRIAQIIVGTSALTLASLALVLSL